MQAIMIISGVFIFLVYFLPVFDRVLNTGNAVGILFGGGFILSGVMWQSISFDLQKYISFALVAFVFGVTALYAFVMSNSKSNAESQRVLVVLGCRVKGDKPSRALAKRIDSAYFYLLKNPNCVAILSGGQGRDEKISEALCMKQILADRGIAESRLFLEDKSTSTYENILFSMKLLEQLGETEIAVATSEYHQKRARLICSRLGLTAYSVSSKTKPTLLPTFALREALALLREYALRK